MVGRRAFITHMTAGLAGLKLGFGGMLEQARHMMQSAPGAETVIDGKRYLYFGGTGYYGLGKSPILYKAACEAMEKYGMHSSTSRAVLGNTPLYEELEKKTAEYYAVEDAAYVPSGYLSDAAGFQALNATERIDAVFVDVDSHYSAIDFAPIIGKPVYTFAHRDAGDLEDKLKKHLKAGQRPLIVSDGVFPLFGQLAPLPAYLSIAEKYEGYIWLDDAHSVGVLGPNGRGTAEHFGVGSDRVFFGGTFSKAFGAHGGHIPGSSRLIKAIRDGHIAHAATASPSAAAAAAIAAMEILRTNPSMRTALWNNAKMMKAGLRQIGFTIADTPHPATAWTLKTPDMDRIYQELFNRNIAIQRLTYSGGDKEGVLRVVVFSTHTTEQINRLLSELKRLA
jgi:8-amino-7-oxononanoate synthase